MATFNAFDLLHASNIADKGAADGDTWSTATTRRKGKKSKAAQQQAQAVQRRNLDNGVQVLKVNVDAEEPPNMRLGT